MTVGEYLKWIAPGKKERIQINDRHGVVCRALSTSQMIQDYADCKIRRCNPDPDDASIDTIIYIESGDTDDTIQP